MVTTPIIATIISMDVSSKGSRNSVKSSFPTLSTEPKFSMAGGAGPEFKTSLEAKNPVTAIITIKKVTFFTMFLASN